MTILLVLLGVAILAFWLTAVLRKYALAKSIMDIPNARSSHSAPTPRGGGVSIVVTFLITVPLLVMGYGLSPDVSLALFGSGALVALIGFKDDQGHIAARWRLLGHFMASAWAVYWLGGLPEIPAFGVSLDLGWVGAVLAVIYLVWLLNLYNFMDGIDGIASVEAISVCLGGAALYYVSGQTQLVPTPLVLGAAVSGFLLWNYPPARIFMGDAGSGFLGMMLGVLSLQAAWALPELIWSWLILLGVFIVDATFTLIRRLCRGDKVYEAHRSHAYQFASRKYKAHLPVTAAVALINLLWLLPVALGVVLFDWDGPTSLVAAYIPLVLLAVAYHAGELEKS